MSSQYHAIGTCPNCGAAITDAHVLIEYESGRYAECPACRDVVDPR